MPPHVQSPMHAGAPPGGAPGGFGNGFGSAGSPQPGGPPTPYVHAPPPHGGAHAAPPLPPWQPHGAPQHYAPQNAYGASLVGDFARARAHARFALPLPLLHC
jgi:hypothetical protein